MRTVVVRLLVASLIILGACKPSDPNRFETHLERIKDPAMRAQGFSGLERLTKTVLDGQDNQDRIDEFATKVIPVLAEVYGEAEEQHAVILELVRDVARPEASAIWNKALKLDGSQTAREHVILALDGIKKSRSEDSVSAVTELLGEVLEKPSLDSGKKDAGRLRVAMVRTLGEIGDKTATATLVKVMEQPADKQPVLVHRAATSALGRIRDAQAIDALLTISFRVPDSPADPGNVGVRAARALAAIGEPAVKPTLKMMRGEHEAVQELAEANSVPQPVIKQTAIGILGTMGANSAVDALVDAFPLEGCSSEGKPRKGNKSATADSQAAAGLRAVLANSLGFIGDSKGIEPVCKCVHASTQPGEKTPMIEALGRMGGPDAVACLADVMARGEFDTEVVREEFRLEPRWEAARYAVLAASPAELGSVKQAIAAANDSTVKEKLKQWDAGIALAESCQADAECYSKTLADVNANWFAREKAAFEVAKLKKGDVAASEAVSAAFKVRNPSARENIAWLAAHMLEPGTACETCVETLEGVLKSEADSLTDPKYLTGVVRAQHTIAALRPASG